MKVRAIHIGTQRHLVLDSDVYDHIKNGRYVYGHEPVPGNYSVGWIRNSTTGEKQWFHDFVMGFHGLKQGTDYEYVEFLQTFNTLVPGQDYDTGELLYPAVDSNAMLDVRFDNLKLIKEKTPEIPVSKYKGVSWIKSRKMWRAFLNSKETESGNTECLKQFGLDIVAARYRDLICVIKGLSDDVLNFPRSNYIGEDGFPVDEESIQAIRCRNHKTQLGYEAALFDDPKQPRPLLIMDRFYPTEDEALSACEKYVKARYGPLSEVYSKAKSKRLTTENINPICQKCNKITPLGVTFLISTPHGSLKVCEDCFNEADKSKSDLPDPDELMRQPNPLSFEYKECIKCGESKPATNEYFQEYKYKGELRLKGECNVCRKLRDMKRYQTKKGKTDETMESTI